MFKAVHGIAPTYLSNRIVINFDVYGYDTGGSDMDLYVPTLPKEAYRNSCMYMGGKLWNDLPEFVQNSTNIGYLYIITACIYVSFHLQMSNA